MLTRRTPDAGAWRKRGRYVASGHLLYSRNEVDGRALRGSAQVSTAAPMAERTPDDEPARQCSDSGILAYVPASARRAERRLVWVDAAGKVEELPAPPRVYADPSIWTVAPLPSRSSALPIPSASDFARRRSRP
jgi:hypothetical protein